MKQLRRRWGALALLAALLLTVSTAAGTFTAFAASVPDPTDDFYVNDYAGVLSDTTKSDIVAKNDGLYAATGAQIVVTVVQSTGGASMEQYATDIANAWGIGDAEKGNGVLLLLSIDDDDYQCIQGSGLETLLPTTTLSRMQLEDLEPDFAAKDYDAGVRKMFASLYDAVCEIYNYDGSTGTAGGSGSTAANTGNTAAHTPSPAPTHTSGGGYGSRVVTMVVVLIIFLVIVVILISIFTAPRRHRTYYDPTPTYTGRSSFGRGFFWGSVLSGRRRRPRNPPPPPPPPPPGGWGGRPSGPRPGGSGFGGPRPPSSPPSSHSSRPSSSGSFGGGFGSSAPRKSSGSSFGSGSSRKTGGFSGSGGFGGSSRSGGGGSFRGGGASRGGGCSGGSRSGGGGSFRGGGAGRGH